MTILWKQTSWTQLVIIPVVFLIVWLCELVGVAGLVRQSWEGMLLPVTVRVRSLMSWTNQPFQVVTDTNSILRRMQQLEYRYAEASAQLGELGALREENQQLKEALSSKKGTTTSETVIAAPLVSLAYPAIAAGEVEGVQPGNAVSVSETLVGTIGQVSPHQSQVNLLSQPDQRPILVQTEGGAQGIVVGDGRRVLITEIPSDQQLTVGERVVTLGQPGIKRDVFVGRIQQVEKSESAPVQTAVLEQYVSFYRARLVFVE